MSSGSARSRPTTDIASDRAVVSPSSTASSSQAYSARESACRSLRILLPILALYTLFSLAWTTPIASVLHSVSSGTSVIRRTPKSDFGEESTTSTGTTFYDPPTQPNVVEEASNKDVVDTSSTTTTTNAGDTSLPDTARSESDSATAPPSTTTSTTTLSTTTTTTTTSSTTAATTSTTTGTTTTTTTTAGTTQPPPAAKVDLPNEGPLVRPTTERRKMYKLAQPECMRGTGRAKTFLMVFMGHSGSTAIMSELKSHPQIHVEQWEPVDHGEIQENTSMALAYTREFFKRGIALGKTPGFKIRPLHIKNDPKAWAALAREFNTRIVWQYRRNALKQAVGEYSYRVLNDNSIVEGLRSAEEVAKRCDIGAGCTFPVKDFAAFHKILTSVTRSDYMIAEAASLIADGRDCVHEMRYEDYLYHRKGAMMDILEFLGADLVDTQPERYKATNDNLCEVVSNWSEFCGAFFGCKV